MYTHSKITNRRRFDEEANMQIYEFCENIILGVFAGVESHCENQK